MRTLRDPDRLLAQGLDAIRAQFAVPPGFPPQVLAAADAATAHRPADHADWTGKPFVTLDPAASTDLDQAFAIEAAGADWLLHYAIADVAWFVADDDPLDREAWARGVTTYLPDGKAGLYPPALSEAAASLLPDGDRPAIVLTVRVAPDGMARLDGARRALIRSRAKLAYETATEADLPAGFAEIAAGVRPESIRPNRKWNLARTVVLPCVSGPIHQWNGRTPPFRWRQTWPWPMPCWPPAPACSAKWLHPMPRPKAACGRQHGHSRWTGRNTCRWPSSKGGWTRLARPMRPS